MSFTCTFLEFRTLSASSSRGVFNSDSVDCFYCFASLLLFHFHFFLLLLLLLFLLLLLLLSLCVALGWCERFARAFKNDSVRRSLACCRVRSRRRRRCRQCCYSALTSALGSCALASCLSALTLSLSCWQRRLRSLCATHTHKDTHSCSTVSYL